MPQGQMKRSLDLVFVLAHNVVAATMQNSHKRESNEGKA